MRRFLNMKINDISPLSQQEYNQKNIMNAMILTTMPMILTTNPHKAMSAILSSEERQLQQNQKPDALR